MMQISRDVYGDEKFWKDIASWNKIEAPFSIHTGQIILLNRVQNLKYRVTEKAPVLSMIALENYGNLKMASVIARWNGLSEDSKLKKGQILILKMPPTLFLKERTAILIKIWKKLNREDIITQIENKALQLKKSTYISTNHSARLVETINPPEEKKSFDSVTILSSRENLKPAMFKESTHESYWLGDDASKIFKILSTDKKFNP